MKREDKIKIRPFDSAEFLDTPEAIGAHLTDALHSGSSAEFQDALNVVARARGMTEIAPAEPSIRHQRPEATQAHSQDCLLHARRYAS